MWVPFFFCLQSDYYFKRKCYIFAISHIFSFFLLLVSIQCGTRTKKFTQKNELWQVLQKAVLLIAALKTHVVNDCEYFLFVKLFCYVQFAFFYNANISPIWSVVFRLFTSVLFSLSSSWLLIILLFYVTNTKEIK